jgi:hypothetical protein
MVVALCANPSAAQRSGIVTNPDETASFSSQAGPPPPPVPELLIPPDVLYPVHEQLPADVIAPREVEPAPDTIRPPDDSDPEMRDLMLAFWELTPCGSEFHGLCPEALAMLRSGGDRLAHYLIRQIEANEREGYPDQGTYLRNLGQTESNVAYEQLIEWEAAKEPAPPHYADETNRIPRLYLLEALGRTRDPRLARDLLPKLRTTANMEEQVRIIQAMGLMQAKHGEQPGVRAALEQLAADVADQGGECGNMPKYVLGGAVRSALERPERLLP